MKKLLSVNNYHYRRGGAEKVFLEHNDMFERCGWNVVPFAMKHSNNLYSEWEKYFPDEIEFGKRYGYLQKILLASKVIYSLESSRRIDALLDKIQFDICHCHNIYHHLSPSILSKLKRRGIPVVMTLHDLKLACPNYQMKTHDGICERCKERRFYNAVIHRCIKDSFSLSALIMVESYVHRLLNVYAKNVNKFIVPSLFYQRKFIEWGMDPSKLIKIPNYVDVEKHVPDFEPGRKYLYFGRLSKEKGLTTLIKAAKLADVDLLIAGTGPEKADLEERAKKDGCKVQFAGFLTGRALENAIKSCRASVLPSEWYENAPMSIKESYALGKPVIGSRIGGIPELVKEGETGITFKCGSTVELAAALRKFSKLPDKSIRQMGQAGRAFVEQHFNKNIYFERVKRLYSSLNR